MWHVNQSDSLNRTTSQHLCVNLEGNVYNQPAFEVDLTPIGVPRDLFFRKQGLPPLCKAVLSTLSTVSPNHSLSFLVRTVQSTVNERAELYVFYRYGRLNGRGMRGQERTALSNRGIGPWALRH